MVQYLSQYNIILVGFLASLTAGLATSAGTLPIFFARDISKRVMDALLGTAAGIMLAATSFSLVIPAIDKAGGGARGAGIVLVGILAGGMFLDLIDKCFPNTNLMANSMPDTGSKSGLFDLHRPEMRKVWMFILAITVHNFPEGMAVGVGFGDGDISNGLSIAIGIGLQNMPEGLAVALPLLREGCPKWKAFLVSTATGLVEPIGGLLGIGLVNIARPMLPFLLAFAAGAMLFVIAHEVIPESQADRGNSKLATYALMVGFVIMMFMDVVLG
ncbi:ZIP family metal transporter [Eubacteriales bacterium mix99]|jgi:ZIP family zinc transporter|nr:ZIP family metal transporter [Clostridiales bacterium]